jgi:uncharacterized membrane protein
MNNRQILWILQGVVLLAAAADLAWYYPQLPAQIATHFNGQGVADGWSDKVGFAVGQGCLLVCMPAMFVGLSWLLPRIPVSLVNLPHRDYWLSPAHRATTLETLSQWMLGAGLLMSLFLGGLMHLMLAANLHPPARLGPWFGVLVGADLTALVGIVTWLFWRFRRPRA